MFNILLGIVFIAGGATKKLTLIGTNSSEALVVIGVGLAAYGAYQMYRARSSTGASAPGDRQDPPAAR